MVCVRTSNGPSISQLATNDLNRNQNERKVLLIIILSLRINIDTSTISIQRVVISESNGYKPYLQTLDDPECLRNGGRVVNSIPNAVGTNSETTHNASGSGRRGTPNDNRSISSIIEECHRY